MELLVVIWLIFGGLIGWVASLLSERSSSQRKFLYIAIGSIGSVMGGLIITNLIGPAIESMSLISFLLAIPVAVFLLSLFEYTAK